MFLFPNAKINIGLNIISKTNSGYHQIQSCFCPISLYDLIEINYSKNTMLTLSGIKLDVKTNDNIIIKAIKKIDPNQNYKIHLHKNIPIGSGLGGGSSDAAFILKHINKINGNTLSKENLLDSARSIGSDCPFFIDNKIKYVTGIGEKMSDIDINIHDKTIVLIDPKTQINTKEAYNNITPIKPKYNLKEILENESINNWSKFITNSFEKYALNKIESLKEIKTYLINLGAKYVSLTGSGSCIYGIFNEKNISKNDLEYDCYITKIIC